MTERNQTSVESTDDECTELGQDRSQNAKVQLPKRERREDQKAYKEAKYLMNYICYKLATNNRLFDIRLDALTKVFSSEIMSSITSDVARRIMEARR